MCCQVGSPGQRGHVTWSANQRPCGRFGRYVLQWGLEVGKRPSLFWHDVMWRNCRVTKMLFKERDYLFWLFAGNLGRVSICARYLNAGSVSYRSRYGDLGVNKTIGRFGPNFQQDIVVLVINVLQNHSENKTKWRLRSVITVIWVLFPRFFTLDYLDHQYYWYPWCLKSKWSEQVKAISRMCPPRAEKTERSYHVLTKTKTVKDWCAAYR